MDNFSMKAQPNKSFLLKLSCKCALLSLRNVPLLFSKNHK
jgi:hypothetical protein